MAADNETKPKQDTEYLQALENERNSLGDPFNLAVKLLDKEITVVKSGKTAESDQSKSKSSTIEHVDVTQGKPIKLIQKVKIPIDRYPKFNFVGKLLGPGGNTLKQLQKDTMCRILIFGRGSMKDKAKEEELRKEGGPKYGHLSEKLHVYIEAEAEISEAHSRIAHVFSELNKLLTLTEDEMYGGGRGGNWGGQDQRGGGPGRYEEQRGGGFEGQRGGYDQRGRGRGRGGYENGRGAGGPRGGGGLLGADPARGGSTRGRSSTRGGPTVRGGSRGGRGGGGGLSDYSYDSNYRQSYDYEEEGDSRGYRGQEYDEAPPSSQYDSRGGQDDSYGAYPSEQYDQVDTYISEEPRGGGDYYTGGDQSYADENSYSNTRGTAEWDDYSSSRGGYGAPRQSTPRGRGRGEPRGRGGDSRGRGGDSRGRGGDSRGRGAPRGRDYGSDNSGGRGGYGAYKPAPRGGDNRSHPYSR